jgi:hypothetical protein
MEITTVDLAGVAALGAVHRAQLASLAMPWFGREARTAEEFFLVLGEEYGEPAEDLEVGLAHLTDEDDPALVLYDYWNEPGSGTGSYFFANSVDPTGCYEVQHFQDGRPLAETLDEARARAVRLGDDDQVSPGRGR